MRAARGAYRACTLCILLLIGEAALYAGGAREDMNTLSALEFELKTTLYGRGYQFEHLRTVLGGFETVEQVIYLMRAPENVAEAMRASFVCVPIAGSSLDIDDEDTENEYEMSFNLAQLSAAELEELPCITPTIAGRIARASKRGELRERWQLLRVSGVTPEIYAGIRKYFTVYEAKTPSANFLKHDIGFIASPDAWSLRNTIQAGEGVRFALRTIHDSKGSLSSPRGWYASGDSFPALARRAGAYLQLGNEVFSILLGNYRIRSPLGLVAGRESYGSGAFGSSGTKSVSVLPQLSDSARDVFTGAALSLSLPVLDVKAFFSARSYFTDADRMQGNVYQGTLRSLIYKQDALEEADTTIINEIIFGSLAELKLGRLNLSAACVLPYYSCAFQSDEAELSMSGERRWHGSLGFSWSEEECSFFGEGACAGDMGYGGTSEVCGHAFQLGIRGKRARLRYSLSYQQASDLLPGLHDGLAGLARAGRGIELQNEWFIFDSLRWQYAVNLYPEAKTDVRSRFNTSLRWKSSSVFELLLQARLVHENNEQESALYRCTLIWSSSSLFSLKVDCGTRFEKGSGSWLTSAILFPIAGARCTLAYGVWQADPKLHLWPSFPVLTSAGDTTLASYTGEGRMAVLKAEIPAKYEKIRFSFKVALKETLQAEALRGLSLAASLQYTL